jgi:Carboxypeptidase regulatory-like domain/TonB dependent receptor-like, beta-barrel/TonB-dependent Receptor Plug Domain
MLKKNLLYRLILRPMALCLYLGIAAASLYAQEGTSTLRGAIVDQSGSVIPGATISVANQATGLNRRSMATNSNGEYVFTSLIPGSYRITVEAQGFKKATQDNVLLAVGETLELKIALQTGGVNETVNVTAEAPIIATTSKEIGGHINQRTLVELPTITRNFIGFVGLLPGVVPNISTESFGSDSINVNGQDSRNNNFLLDGANNNDDVIGQRAGGQTRTALETVQEFQVLTNQFDAQYGRTSGAIINAITKSGTNQFHGSGIGFFQDGAFNAKNRFAILTNAETPEIHLRQYGGTIGGPIKQDFAHFFFGIERTTIAEGVIINIPARPEFNASTTEDTKALNTSIRLDMQPAQNHQIAGRWVREHSPQFNQIIPFAAGVDVTLDARREEDDTDQTVVGSWTAVVTPNLLNDLRINFTREDVAFANPGFNSGKSMAELPPTLLFPSLAAQQSNVAQARVNNSYRLADTVNWVRGGHSFKFGFEYNYVTADNITEDSLNGVFSFPTNMPFNAADPSTYPERLQIRVPGAQKFVVIAHNPSVFAQDAWKVNRNLTLNLGLRYDDETISQDNNNFSPRVGLAYDFGGEGKTVIRAGFGYFYQNTPFELITGFRTARPFSDSFVRLFPLNNPDPGPRAGLFPTDPTLAKGPVVDRALIQSLVGSGLLLPNPNPTVDQKDRRMAYTRSVSAGFQRELAPSLALTVDYIHTDGIDQLISANLNATTRTGTSSTAALAPRRFATLGQVIQNTFVEVDTKFFNDQPFSNAAVNNVTTILNEGRTKYDALQIALDKRLSRGLDFKLSYTLSKGRGNTSGNGVQAAGFQLLDDLRLDLSEGPSAFDRRHNFVFSGYYEIPRTRGLIVSGLVRSLSGTPFTLIDSRVDADRNGINNDPLPAGNFTNSRTFPNGETLTFNFENEGGRNGARNPGFLTGDLRVAYKYNITERINAGFTFDIFNIANRTNFDGPSGDFQGGVNPNFLLPTIISPNSTPRTLQLGFRVSF